MKKVAIIGAGLSGLTAAYFLENYAEVFIFEKSNGLGGRMSTRRHDPYFFDHGAQYFTVKTKQFLDFIKPLIDNGAVKRWDTKCVNIVNYNVVEEQNWNSQQPRFVGVPGMNQLVKHFATGRNIFMNKRVVSIEVDSEGMVRDENGKTYNGFDLIILAVPGPQALSLLLPSFNYYDEIKKIEMNPCFSLLLGFDKEFAIDFGAAKILDSDVSWLAVNSKKPGRSDPFSLVLQSSVNFARKNINEDHKKIMMHLMEETTRIIKRDVSSASVKKIHRWVYASNQKKENKSFFLDRKLKLAVCGDWCNNGKVEGAFCSAYDLVAELKNKFF